MPSWGWQKLTGEARTRILLSYLLLLGFFVVVAMPLMRYFVILQVNTRVHEDLIEDMEIFEGLLEGNPQILERFDVGREHPEIIGKLPPTTPEKLDVLFHLYLTRRIPEDDTIFLTFIEGQFHFASVEARPQILQPGSDLFQYFISQTQSIQGELKTDDPHIGTILYYVKPIQANGKSLGTFVALHMNEGERQEIFDAFGIVFQVMLCVLVLALVLAWLIAGRVLAPLRLLTDTARTITETELAQRIPIQGKGELADLAKTFNDMMDRVEMAFDTQRKFLNDVSHELRTPITIVRGHLEVMGNEPQEQKKTLSIVLNELDRMNRFVQDLLLLAKAERSDFLRFDTIDVRSFTEELFAKATALADRNWQLDAVASCQLVGDRQRITEAIMNLAQNATQHTRSHDTIALGSSIQQSRIQFWVRDTGEGIAPENQQRIFERFVRVSKNPCPSEGVGLGLSIVKAIAEAHGGEIGLDSQLGTGSTFTLTLPLDSPREMVLYDYSYSNR
jgi:signal transduction histidine kinase